MTYSRPSVPSSPVVDARHRKHRGPINKRACQKCRQGKVKCDGNAETGSTCSNCDPGQCHYDQSPRKNKQVETLKKQIDNISAQLEVSKKAVETFKKRDVLQERQDEVMKNLTKRVEYFVNRLDVFRRLMTLLMDGHYLKEMLVLIDALLGHFDTQQQPVDEIINHLERWADICSRLQRKSALRNIINPSEQAKSLTSNFRAAAQSHINLQNLHPRPLESPPPSVQHSPTTAPAVQLNGVPIPAVITTQGADLHSPVISDDASSHSSYGTSEEFPRTPVNVSPQLGGHSPSPSSPVTAEFVTADNCQFFTTQQQQTHQLQLQHQQQQQREEGQQHNQSLHLQHHHQQQQQHILQQHQQQQHQQAHHIPQQELLNSLMSQETTYLDSAMMDPTLLGYTPFAYQNFDGAEEPIPES